MQIIIIGASGHGKVISDIISYNIERVGGGGSYKFLDGNIKRGTEIHGYPVIGTVEECVHYPEAHFLIGIGDNLTRKKIAETYELNYITAIHPTAVIGENVHIGNGTVVMANAVINADAKIGKHCIINTSAVIEHECTIGDYTHVSPQACLCGNVHVGEECHIGAGATIINNKNIVNNIIIGAENVVIRDINESGTYAGSPIRRIG
ncbi:sugar O-acyltransferase, sialic acid O-acetyltransferase NeuD family [Eubacterium callanderi]|uniref:acetyltransferase n=1 Tax=Eubacterium callanderi TaxID=53442 RepID=UPI0008E2EF9D|nr:acetyltransferase [Eubacterium callanderi]SFO43813.1 sugar O-acyltransferase, sialic acid O-acetyltransferase NeuD family [Eubacterium callanderi]